MLFLRRYLIEVDLDLWHLGKRIYLYLLLVAALLEFLLLE